MDDRTRAALLAGYARIGQLAGPDAVITEFLAAFERELGTRLGLDLGDRAGERPVQTPAAPEIAIARAVIEPAPALIVRRVSATDGIPGPVPPPAETPAPPAAVAMATDAIALPAPTVRALVPQTAPTAVIPVAAPPPRVSVPVAADRPPRTPMASDADLVAIAERFGHQAAVLRGIAEGRCDEDRKHRARSAGTPTWAWTLPAGPALDALACAFAGAADTLGLVARLRARDDLPGLRDVVPALAGALSALRLAVAAVRPEPDPDQDAAFAWLRALCEEERIFVRRHMRLGDPLDPSELDAFLVPLRERLVSERDAEARTEERARRVRQLVFHGGRIRARTAVQADHDTVAAATAALVALGLPPSSLELREHLADIVERTRPTDPPSAWDLVVREIRRARAARPTSISRAARPAPEVEAEVARVRELIAGTRVVLIGGELRVDARDRLVAAFGLRELAWLTLSDSPSEGDVETVLARGDTSVCIQLVRWSRHAYGVARDVAERHGVPFVRVPAGYNPRAVAQAIESQASGRLARRGALTA